MAQLFLFCVHVFGRLAVGDAEMFKQSSHMARKGVQDALFAEFALKYRPLKVPLQGSLYGTIIIMKLRAIILSGILLVTCHMAAQDVMHREKDGTYVINTTTLAADVMGFRDATPVEIYIKNDIIQKIVILNNQDGPKYIAEVKRGLLPKFIGKSAKKLKATKVDAVTGATFSSNAIKENVQRGLLYYKKHKK